MRLAFRFLRHHWAGWRRQPQPWWPPAKGWPRGRARMRIQSCSVSFPPWFRASRKSYVAHYGDPPFWSLLLYPSMLALSERIFPAPRLVVLLGFPHVYFACFRLVESFYPRHPLFAVCRFSDGFLRLSIIPRISHRLFFPDSGAMLTFQDDGTSSDC